MNLDQIQKEKKAISPIIATLLLILIAIAAGVIVYAYVVGFIGGSTSNSGGSTSVIQITNFCASAANQKCNSGNAYYITVLNVGSTTIPTGSAEVYFTDITSSTVGSTSTSCSNAGGTTPSSTYVCRNASWPSGYAPNSGDTLTVKIVNPDSGASTSSTKVIA